MARAIQPLLLRQGAGDHGGGVSKDPPDREHGHQKDEQAHAEAKSPWSMFLRNIGKPEIRDDLEAKYARSDHQQGPYDRSDPGGSIRPWFHD